MSAGEVDLLTAMIAEGALALVLFYSLLARRKITVGRRTADILLILLSAASIFAYVDFGRLRMGPRDNPHDFFHYYVGAKYSPELGYTNLYRCTLVADMEANEAFKRPTSIRNLEDYHYESVSRVLSNAGQYKALFEPARWDEFCVDVEHFRSLLPHSRWNRLFKDKGYNATPVWNMVGRFLTNRAPTDSELAMALLVALDPALVVVMLLFVARAFGWRAALFALIFHTTNFMMSFLAIKASFLRLDWVTLMVISVCLLKLRHYKSAGMALAYAAAVRIFPLIFAFGLGVRCVSHLIRTRTIHRGHLGFFVLFLLVILVLVGAAALDHGGVGSWNDFYDKITMHNDDVHSFRVGFKYVFLMTYGRDHEPWSTFAADVQNTFKDRRVVWWTILGAVLIISAYVVRNLEDYEAVAFGAVPTFFLVAPTYYYYVYLLIPLFLFLPKLAQLDRALGLVGMFAFSIAAFILSQFFHLDLSLTFLLSCMMLALVLYMTVVALRCDPHLQHGVAALGRSLRARPRRWVAVAVLVAGVSGGLILRSVFRVGPVHHSKTSVLMLTLCTVRADHLGCYGYERDVSPNIDRLAADGFRFQRVLAQAPWTRSGVAAIITGMYPRSLNIEDPENQENYRKLHDDFTTMAEVMHEYGCYTIGVTANPNTNAVFGFDQGYDHYDDPGALWQDGYGRKNIWSSADVNRRFLSHLDTLADGTRFFAHLVYIDAHSPLIHKLEVDKDDNFTLPPRSERKRVDTYDLQISHLDENIGLLRAELARRGYGEDLLIVINADHGEAFQERHPMDQGHSRRVYNSTIWVPWILHHPKLGRTLSTFDGMVEQIDMLPTLLDLLGIPPSSASRGKSALAGASRVSVLTDQDAAEEVAWSVVRTQFRGADKAAVVTPEHKLILNFDWQVEADWTRQGKKGPYHHPPEFELYAYWDDWLEQDNRYAQDAELAATLRGYYETWKRDYPPLVELDEIRVTDKDIARSKEQLRNIGYAGDDDENVDTEDADRTDPAGDAVEAPKSNS
ncbi:MAG: sulfatase-like hydrolase/transferase [Planctomycetes bacterium]|nr:sulfatase-like hydrolase/transferase [Planctomycetota bacterium]